MKLTLEHLAPYLPYDVSYGSMETDWGTLKPKFKVRGIATTRGTVDNINNWMDIETSMLVLRPLSDLTKEINMEGDMVSVYEILPRREKEDYKDPILSYWSWEAMNILFEYHFDVFGLIDANLAIDINTINN